MNFALLIVFLIAGFYGLYQGYAFKSKQVKTIEAFRLEKEQAFEKLVAGFAADATTAEGKAAYQNVTTFSTANRYTTLPAYKTPNTVSIFSIGQADVFPYYLTVKLESFFMQLFKQNEIANPLRSLAGHFDVTFWMIYLLPLLIVVLSFNALSSELDNQNWRLINSQGVTARQWVGSKILLVALCITGLVLIVVLTGSILNAVVFNQSPGFSDVMFLVTVVFYLGFWLAALYLINSLATSTSAGALSSGTLWIVICIVMPSLVTSFIEKAVPVDNTVVSRMSRRPQDARLDNNVASMSIINRFVELRPQFKGATIDTTNRWFGFAKYFAYHEIYDDTSKVSVSGYFQNIERRQTLNNWSIVLNPAAATDGLLTGYARNDAAANHNFIWSVRDFHQQMRSALFPPVFFEQALTQADFEKLPDFSKSTPENQVAVPWLNLVLFGVISMSLMLWGNRNLNVKTT